MSAGKKSEKSDWRSRCKPMAVDAETAIKVASMVKCQFDGEVLDMDYFIREVIMQAMAAAKGRQVNAGALIGMSNSQIAYAIARYSIDPRHGRPAPMVRVRRIMDSEVG